MALMAETTRATAPDLKVSALSFSMLATEAKTVALSAVGQDKRKKI
jgi:hypothetical protein